MCHVSAAQDYMLNKEKWVWDRVSSGLCELVLAVKSTEEDREEIQEATGSPAAAKEVSAAAAGGRKEEQSTAWKVFLISFTPDWPWQEIC